MTTPNHTIVLETPRGPEADPTVGVRPRWAGFVAGATGAGVALTLGELFDGLSTKMPSLVIAVADLTKLVTPGEVIRWSIRTFGSFQKTLLPLVITILAVVIGGVVASRSKNVKRSLTVAFLGFGVFGGIAVADFPQSSPVLGFVLAMVCALVGLGTAALLLSRFSPRASTAAVGPGYVDPRVTNGTRRSFLNWTGGLAASAVAMGFIGRSLEKRANVEKAREAVEVGGTEEIDAALAQLNTLDAVPDISPYITPADDFYLIDTAFVKPQVNPDTWRLRIAGMVDNPFEITLGEIQQMDLIDVPVTLSCVSNYVGGDLVGNAIWTGIPITTLLERAGVQEGADQFTSRSVDDWSCGFPTDLLYDGRDALLAIGMNGEPLQVKHGFPARLVVSGVYGYVSATKWVTEINLTTWESFDGFWVPRGWSKEGPIKTQSRIDTPGNGSQLQAGPGKIGGVAWAPTRGISLVEVQVDGGDWLAASVGEVLSNDTWAQWSIDWDFTPGRHYIRVRATDGTGETQGEELVDVAPNGAEGWHTIQIDAV